METLAKIKEFIKNEYGFLFELESVCGETDQGGATNCYHYRCTNLESGNIYKFVDRNIFDFGRCINPVFPVDGGLAINIESYIEKNNAVFNSTQKQQEYRDAHPTKTGWGWNRFCYEGDQWIEMSNEEIRAYKIVIEYGNAYRVI